MPTVAVVAGVKIQFFFADHHPPHFHFDFGSHRGQIAIETLEVLSGTLPAAKLRAVREWATSRKPELAAAWKHASLRENPGKIL